MAEQLSCRRSTFAGGWRRQLYKEESNQLPATNQTSVESKMVDKFYQVKHCGQAGT